MAARFLVGEIGPTLERLAPELTGSTYALILTRGHKHDEEALLHLAESSCGYVGMIGSARKIRLIVEDLTRKGIRPESLEPIHAPLGLPIGSRTVPEIAVSIVAELIACRNQGGSSRPTRTGPALRVGSGGSGEESEGHLPTRTHTIASKA
jgi:xanthine dehydrogenase accessory factor